MDIPRRGDTTAFVSVDSHDGSTRLPHALQTPSSCCARPHSLCTSFLHPSLLHVCHPSLLCSRSPSSEASTVLLSAACHVLVLGSEGRERRCKSRSAEVWGTGAASNGLPSNSTGSAPFATRSSRGVRRRISCPRGHALPVREAEEVNLLHNKPRQTLCILSAHRVTSIRA